MTRTPQSKRDVPVQIGRRERRRLETREKLYRTAMELFAKHGFSATSTGDITDAADVGQGTFFNYFPTKAHVLIVLSEKQIEKVEASRLEAESGEIPIREVFHRLVHKIVEELARSQALTRSLLTAFVSHDEVRELMAQTLGEGREKLAKIIALGQERNEIRKDRKPSDMAAAFQRGVLGTLLMWALQSKGDLHGWLEKTLDDFWTIAAAKKR